MTKTIPAQLAENVAASGESVWLTSPETGMTVTWAEAYKQVNDIARQLHQLGLAPGEPVVVAAHNCIASTILFTAVTSAGYLATPLNLVSGAKAMSYVLSHCKAKVLFCTPENRSLIDEVSAPEQCDFLIIPLHPEDGPVWPTLQTDSSQTGNSIPDSDSPALLMYTSGTTGNPKGVVLSHANLLAAGQNVVTAHQITSDDTGLCVLPIYHINGLCVTVMGSLVSSGGLVIPRRFSARHFWTQMHKFNCSWF
ncbi:MAG: AMP-binding protein, partial [Pseudomonadota bacterium]|nr:AMP-binding protein [Pseudomonadota bacterium]